MKKYFFGKLKPGDLKQLCKRPANPLAKALELARPILARIKKNGDRAIRAYTKEYDGVTLSRFAVNKKEILAASSRISLPLQRAFKVAAKNIEKFHKAQIASVKKIETTKGVVCYRQTRPIKKVGLYIPGGRAPLPSTVLMLGIPAKIAGCNQTILCTPPDRKGRIPDIILYAAHLAGITQVFKVGGAQAIAAMGYGTQTVPKADKIFGPGNSYVTAAKLLISIDPEGAAIDLPAGPTEVMVIADKKARADFAASDLLSQAEHGPDSQAILLCTDAQKTEEILMEIKKQFQALPRKEIARKALENSFAIVLPSLKQAIEFANDYAPEHLILNVVNPESYSQQITNAGSVFLGPYACEAAGDYATGANHTLPTYGYARAYSGVSLDSFQKGITFQKLTQDGARKLGPIVAQMARAEGLEGHRKAMELRYSRPSLLAKYAFLDRDGTLIYEPPDTKQIDSIKKLRILKGVLQGLRTLQRKGYRLILVSNQDGLGTASFPRPNFLKPHNCMLDIFQRNRIQFEKIFICPHRPSDQCRCRKPKTGLVDSFFRKAIKIMDRENSFICGDRPSDKEFAKNLGLRFIPIKTNGSFTQVLKTIP